ncbi:MAG: HEAT repeat domain-containing protein [Planctomycetes bacterium]|nr:HEAT repeat domain-containing protein [Planctomycetota bacterium]MBL7044366.1 HEAT repeat domain-containing protein [Pirellulaceae bacterium]
MAVIVLLGVGFWWLGAVFLLLCVIGRPCFAEEENARIGPGDLGPAAQRSLTRRIAKTLIGDDSEAREEAATELLLHYNELTPRVIELINKEEYSVRFWSTQALLRELALERFPKSKSSYPEVRGLIPTLVETARRDIAAAPEVEDYKEHMARGLNANWLGVLLGRSKANEGDLQRAVPVLRDLLTDETAYVQARTLSGIVWMGPKAKPLVPELVNLLQNPTCQHRFSVCDVLRRIGPEAKEAVPALLQALTDPRMKAVARWSLERIDPAALKKGKRKRKL